jgi:hypothetical protein
MSVQSLLHLRTNAHGVVSRRAFLKAVSVSGAGLGILGWQDGVTLHAQELRRQGRACILLFMRGAPSQFETFDPKPGTATGGPTEAIDTAVPGIRIARGWENVAREMRDIALIRSMTNREGEHQRATYQLHTGYVPAGGVRHPSLGAIAAHELGQRDFDLPHFVSIGGRLGTIGSGFLGARVAPFVVTNPSLMPANVTLPGGVAAGRYSRRLDLMRDLEQDFAESGGRHRVAEHRALYDNASRMVLSPRLRAFDLSQERDQVRDRYGRTPFGQGCLLARRLVEQGVTFVEVDMPNWDTHQDNFNRTSTQAQTADPAFAALVGDLRERGLMERTLVIWMGEFGRTPRINANNGRDHFPLAFNVALAGGGVRGGQVIGSTNASGTAVTNRPVTVPDLFCSFCQALGINPRREFMTPLGRPIRIVDGGTAVAELFG